MGNSKNITLDRAVEAMRILPEEAQAELAKELVAVVAIRLATPRAHIGRNDFLARLRRYNPTL